MESQPVICPNCSSQVRGEDINIHSLLGKCSRCDHIFRLPLVGSPIPESHPGPEPSRPSGVTMEVGLGGELLIFRRWFEPGLFFLLFFCIAWDGFLVFWYTAAIFGNACGKGPFDWLAILFPICHVAVGIGLTYFVIAGFLNTSTVLVDDQFLFVRHGPVPWLGNRNVAVDEIQGIEIDYVSSQEQQPSYSVSAHMDDGRQLVLLRSVKSKQAEYIAWQLASRLGVSLSHNNTVA